MLAGHPPFTGASAQQILARHAFDDPPPLRTVRNTVTPGIEAVIARALAKSPVDRFATAAEFKAALTETRAPGRTTGHATTTLPPGHGAPAQVIRYCTTADGVSVAYSKVGSGPFLVRVMGHCTHLEMEWEWPDLRRFWELLAERFTVIRYDGRGMGLSDRYPLEFDEETRQRDLEAVLEASGASRAVLLGISEGGWSAATYATRHPDRVSRLVLYGAYCRGARARPHHDAEEDEALLTLIRKGWGRDSPAFRQIYTSQFFRDGADPALTAHFNDLLRASADPDTAARFHASAHSRGDGRDLYRQVAVPTLVVHCREDLAVSAEEGRLLAAVIPGAQLVLLPGETHYFPADPEVVAMAVEAIERFLHQPG